MCQRNAIEVLGRLKEHANSVLIATVYSPFDGIGIADFSKSRWHVLMLQLAVVINSICVRMNMMVHSCPGRIAYIYSNALIVAGCRWIGIRHQYHGFRFHRGQMRAHA